MQGLLQALLPPLVKEEDFPLPGGLFQGLLQGPGLLHRGNDAPAALHGGLPGNFLQAGSLFLRPLPVQPHHAPGALHRPKGHSPQLHRLLGDGLQLVPLGQALADCHLGAGLGAVGERLFHPHQGAFPLGRDKGAGIVRPLPITEGQCLSRAHPQGPDDVPAVLAAQQHLPLGAALHKKTGHCAPLPFRVLCS